MVFQARTFGALAVLLLFVSSAPSAAAGASEQAVLIQAELNCPEFTRPGRVTCAVQLAPSGQGKLVWADAIVVQAPELARPLRSRVVARKSEGGGPWQVSLAFLAAHAGRGRIEVRARGVVCFEGSSREARAERCLPSAVVVEREVVVSP